MTTAVPYRVFDLPWTPSEDEERGLRRILGAVLGVFIACGVVIPLLPEREKPAVPPAVPERIVEFILQRPKPVEPPPPVVKAVVRPVELPVERPEPRVERVREVQPTPQPTPVPPQPEAPTRPDPRERARSAGLLALSNQLADLREIDTTTNTKPVTVGAASKATVDRSVLSSNLGSGSRGIQVAKAGSVSQGAKALAGHETAKVDAASSAPAVEAKRSGSSTQASRTREEIELVFDRNKSAIYSIYSRALRDNPALQGKLVIELTIAPSGEVTGVRVVSSELGDAELERKLIGRVKMFMFEDKDVAVMTTTKPIEFFPA